MEIEWARLNSEKGTLFLLDDGLYFQKYESDSLPYLLGDSISINRTGIFGAANYYKKLQGADADLASLAKDKRKNKNFDTLVEDGVLIRIKWSDIVNVVRKRFSRSIVLFTRDGKKITLANLADKDAVLNFILNRIQTK